MSGIYVIFSVNLVLHIKSSKNYLHYIENKSGYSLIFRRSAGFRYPIQDCIRHLDSPRIYLSLRNLMFLV